MRRRRSPRPPRSIPEELLSQYDLDGKINVKYRYFNDIRPLGSPTVYGSKEIDPFIEKVRRKEELGYGELDLYLYESLHKYDIRDKEVAIMGSEKPRYEAVCLVYGGRPVTIEYNKIVSEYEGLRALTVESYESDPFQFDIAFSLSSFEHDGLGRYGDKLNPNGDLEAMKKMKDVLKPNGIFFLAVPVGMDCLVWNAQRIYGAIRLPMLLDGWEMLDSYGFEESQLAIDTGLRVRAQPIFVLRNTL